MVYLKLSVFINCIYKFKTSIKLSQNFKQFSKISTILSFSAMFCGEKRLKRNILSEQELTQCNLIGHAWDRKQNNKQIFFVGTFSPFVIIGPLNWDGPYLLPRVVLKCPRFCQKYVCRMQDVSAEWPFRSIVIYDMPLYLVYSFKK